MSDAPFNPAGGPPPADYPPPAAYQPPPSYAAPPKKGKTWVKVLAIVLSLLILGFVGCCVMLYKLGKSHLAMTSQGAVIVLHQQMKSHDDAAIYNSADPAYQQQTTRAQSDAQFDRISSLLGDPVKAQIVEEKKSGLAAGDDVVDLYVLTTFTKGSANESLQFHKGADGNYHLVKYGAESDNLR